MAPKREVEIKISGDSSDALKSIQELENAHRRHFNQMSENAKQESKEIADAFKKTGIRMEKDIKKSTADAKAAYKKIKDSGKASANDIARAHASMTAKIKKNNRELEKGNTGLIASFKKVKGGLVTTGIKVAAIGAVAAGAFGVKAVKEAIKFEDAILDLQKVLSDSEGSASQYGDTAKAMALTIGVSAAEVLQSASDFKQAGFNISEAFELTDASLKLAIASELDAAQASEVLVRTLNGFKAPASEADRLINVLNTTSANFATNVGELSEGMKDISGIAQKAGFSFEETAGLLVPVIEVFGSGSEAARALRSGMLKLISSQKPVTDELSRLGIHQRELNESTGEYDGKLRSAKDILLDVSAAFKGMDENQKLVTTGILAGTEQAGKMSEVFDGMEKSIAVTNNALKDTDSISKEVATKLSGTGTQLDRLGTAFNNMAQSIGKEALPAIKSFVDVMIPTLQWLGGAGVRIVLEVQKAWLEMSISVNTGLGLIAKATDAVGITRNASETIAIDQEKLTKRLLAVEDRLFKTSEEGIAQEKEVAEKKAITAAETAKQASASALRTQEMLAENSAMLTLVETLKKEAAARRESAAAASREAEEFKKLTFVGPLLQSGATAPGLPGFNTGGHIPGYGGGDTVPIMAEPGEHVIRKESVKKLGRGAAQAFNRGDIAGLINSLPVQKFQEGGEVQGANGPAANVNLIMNDKSFPVTATQNVAEEFISEIKNINTVRGRKKQIY